MNITVTIFGSVLSAIFIAIVCFRLLCFRPSNQHSIELPSSRRANQPVNRRGMQGLQQSTVATFPTILYSQHLFISSEDSLCTICLSNYKENEALRVLPRCGHTFHVTCIDTWLQQHPTCPVCRVGLHVFPNWRGLSASLISISAKSRFAPGAIPDAMFEQPRGLANFVVSVPKSICKKSSNNADSSVTIEVSLRESSCYAKPGNESTIELPESSLIRQLI